jgi:superfamily II DNA helicase RecQ
MPPPSKKRLKATHSKAKNSDAFMQCAPFPNLTAEDLKDLPSIIKEKLGYPPRKFQRDTIKWQLKRKDILIHAATGMGKTLVAAAPHYHPAAEGMVTLMVSPLIALQNEQVSTEDVVDKAAALGSELICSRR